jgi:hypothetical protein
LVQRSDDANHVSRSAIRSTRVKSPSRRVGRCLSTAYRNYSNVFERLRLFP